MGRVEALETGTDAGSTPVIRRRQIEPPARGTKELRASCPDCAQCVKDSDIRFVLLEVRAGF